MYLLPALQRVLFNPLDKPENERLRDLSWREAVVLAPLLACIVWIGVHPQPLLRRMEPAARRLVQQVRTDAGGRVPPPPAARRDAPGRDSVGVRP
jgi:NADH:ubiquinone oxidoreductase subunit 4 (subunit M)